MRLVLNRLRPLSILFLIFFSSTSFGQRGSGEYQSLEHQKIEDNVKHFMERFDGNEDGVLGESEIKNSDLDFRRIDLDEDQRVSRNELFRHFSTVSKTNQRRSGDDIANKTKQSPRTNKSSESNKRRSGANSNDNSRFERYVDGLLKVYDKNSDGKLDADENKKLRRKFESRFDANGDGVFDRQEMITSISKPSAPRIEEKPAPAKPAPTQQEILKEVGIAQTMNNKMAESMAVMALRAHDSNKNSRLDNDELKNVNWSHPDWQRSDANGDGALDQEELVNRYERIMAERMAAQMAAGGRHNQPSRSGYSGAPVRVRIRDAEKSPTVQHRTSGVLQVMILNLPSNASNEAFGRAISTLKSIDADKLGSNIGYLNDRIGEMDVTEFFLPITNGSSAESTASRQVARVTGQSRTRDGKTYKTMDYVDTGCTVKANPQFNHDGALIQLEIGNSGVDQTESSNEEEVDPGEIYEVELSTTVKMEFGKTSVIAVSNAKTKQVVVLLLE